MTQVDDSPTHASERPRYTLVRAAQMTGASLSTVKRRLKSGAFPNAEQDESGTWVVGVDDLLAAGFHLNRTAAGTDPVTPDDAQLTQARDPGLTERIMTLERLLAVETVRREAAEQIAVEREKRAETAERALLMLQAAVVRPVSDTDPPRPDAAVTPPPPAAPDDITIGPTWGRFRRWLAGE